MLMSTVAVFGPLFMLMAKAVKFRLTLCAETPAPGVPSAADIASAARASLGTSEARIVHLLNEPAALNL